MDSDSTAAREARVRRELAKDGYRLAKDRARAWSLNHQGGYVVIETNRNLLVSPDGYRWDLDDVEEWARS